MKGNLRGCCCNSGSWVVKAVSKFVWQFITDCCWYVKPSEILRENKSIIGKLGTWLTWDNKMPLPLGSPAETSPSAQSCLANIKNAYFITQTDGAKSPVTSRGNCGAWGGRRAPRGWLEGGTRIERHWGRSRRCHPQVPYIRMCALRCVCRMGRKLATHETRKRNDLKDHKMPHDHSK